MQRLALAAAWLLASSLAAGGPASAENWPGWRGPRGDGTSREENVPIRWDGQTGQNIAWKTAVPGDGYASPIVWNDRIFLVSCLKESQERILLSLNRRTGEVQWQRTVLEAPLESKHPQNSYASSTPATDGELIFVTFLEVGDKTIPAPNVGRSRSIKPGRMVVAAYDFQGRREWVSRPGEFISAHGFSSSPVLYKDLVIVNGDHDGDSYIVALKKATGEIAWKVPRRHGIRSYVTPIIRQFDGRTQMVLSGSQHVASFDPADGSLHWTVQGPTEQFVASLVENGQSVFVVGGFPTHHVMAIRPDGTGDVTDTHVLWHNENVRCYVPSPVVVDDYLLVADDRGTANCYDTATGERLWRARMGRHFHASLIAADGLVYFLADDGRTKIVEPGPELDVVRVNTLGEFTYASPAVSQGHLYIRSLKHLYSIGPSETAAGK